MILAVGRLSKEKAQIDLLRAFKKLIETHAEINARLVIVGDGPERRAVGSRRPHRSVLAIESSSLGKLTTFRFTYAAADVLVNPSHSEGSPYVLLEAMAAGLPIVATAVGGVPEMVENNETALLVPAGDPQAMADAIARMLKDEKLAAQLAENAREIVSSRSRLRPTSDLSLKSIAQLSAAEPLSVIATFRGR